MYCAGTYGAINTFLTYISGIIMKKNLLIRLKPLVLGAIVLLIAQPANSAFRIPDLANGDIYDAGDFEHGSIELDSRGSNVFWLISD